ncbi:hypothetical protein GCM10028821_08230 [Hymenobacter jeollabukensis]
MRREAKGGQIELLSPQPVALLGAGFLGPSPAPNQLSKTGPNAQPDFARFGGQTSAVDNRKKSARTVAGTDCGKLSGLELIHTSAASGYIPDSNGAGLVRKGATLGAAGRPSPRCRNPHTSNLFTPNLTPAYAGN